ncbi:MAG: hypothetical protein GEU73_00415 [Chloroflexi bacterium]|nr:hypothetical protein [Chloroflexota bacterium]
MSPFGPSPPISRSTIGPTADEEEACGQDRAGNRDLPQPNAPTPKRCYQLGQAIRRVVDAWDSDLRVAVLASGGLSHTLIDEEIDRITIDAMTEKDPEPLWALPVDKVVNGTSEIRNWIVEAGAMETVQMTLVDYVPTYRSLGGTGCGMAFAYWK